MTFDGIRQIIDTRGRRCPMMLGEPCIGVDCAFWMRDTIGNDQGKAVWVEGCLHAFQYVVARDAMAETRRINATVDKQTAVIATAGRAIGAAVVMRPAQSELPHRPHKVLGEMGDSTTMGGI